MLPQLDLILTLIVPRHGFQTKTNHLPLRQNLLTSALQCAFLSSTFLQPLTPLLFSPVIARLSFCSRPLLESEVSEVYTKKEFAKNSVLFIHCLAKERLLKFIHYLATR